MKQLFFIWVIWMLVPTLVFAANPWDEIYAERAETKAQQAATSELPAELPAVQDAISSAREQAGLGSVLTVDSVARDVAHALEKEGAGEKIRIELFQAPHNGILLNHRAALTYEIKDVSYNARAMNWEAMLYPYESTKPLAPIKLQGSYDEVVNVPVLVRRVHRDEIITAADIKWEEVEASRLRPDTAMEEKQIIGYTPLRTISPDRSVRTAELTKPAVIHKNERVTLQYRTSNMELKTLGEAMEDGAEGDIIRIRNKDSHQPVQARIIAAGLAEAMPLGVLAQAGGY